MEEGEKLEKTSSETERHQQMRRKRKRDGKPGVMLRWQKNGTEVAIAIQIVFKFPVDLTKICQ